MTISNYATLAAAALVGANEASSQIVYNDIDPDVLIPYESDNSGDVFGDFDIDGDGISDFSFHSALRAYGNGLGMSAMLGDLAFAGTRYTSFFNSCTVYGLALRGGYNRTIDGNLFFGNPGSLLVSTFPCGDVSKWDEGQTGFLAIRKGSGATARYGWLRVERLPGSENVRLLDFAMEQTPNVAIQAGDPGDACLIPENLTTVVDLADASLGWDRVPKANYFHLEGVEVSTGNTVYRNQASSSVLASGLDPGAYQWRVRAECASGPSAFSDFQSFTIASLRTKDHEGKNNAAWSTSNFFNGGNDAASLGLLGLSAEGQFARVQLRGWTGPVALTLFDRSGRQVWQGDAMLDGDMDVPLPAGVGGIYALQARSGKLAQSVLIPSW